MKVIKLFGGLLATVDDEDFALVSQYKWYAHTCGKTTYAIANKSRANGQKGGHVSMHRLVMQEADRKVRIDHENLNGLINEKWNLRRSTHAQNLMNRGTNKNSTSGIKGVTWNKDRKKWQAQIKFEFKNNYIGLFDCKEAAGRAYDEKARELFGIFARCNFPINSQPTP